MHDPLVVAWNVPLPLPRLTRYRKPPEGVRWAVRRRRRTNPENLGEPVYGWHRPCGWSAWAAGREVRMRRLATIWHVEPGGADSGDVCPHHVRWTDSDGRWQSRPVGSWRWHVVHVRWHVWTVTWGRDGFGISTSKASGTRA